MKEPSAADDVDRVIVRTINEQKPRTVEQLVSLLAEQIPLTNEEILDAILKLQSQGTIKLESQPLKASLSFAIYLTTGQAGWYWATMAIAVITAAFVFLVPESFYPLTYLRTILGAIFIFWLPGYALIRTLFLANATTKGSSKNLGTIERIALSIGTSLALVPITGLILNYTPWGIRLTPIVLSLFALILVFATAAVIREQHQIKKTGISER